MNAKISIFVICVEAILYLLLHNLHDCIFKDYEFKIQYVSLTISFTYCKLTYIFGMFYDKVYGTFYSVISRNQRNYSSKYRKLRKIYG